MLAFVLERYTLLTPGLSPINKKNQKNSQISDFLICVPIKNSEEKSAKNCQLAAPKTCQKKFVDIKFFEFVKKNFRTQIFFLIGLSPGLTIAFIISMQILFDGHSP